MENAQWPQLTAAAYGLNVVATYGIGAGGFKKMGLLSPMSKFRTNKEISAIHSTLVTPVSILKRALRSSAEHRLASGKFRHFGIRLHHPISEIVTSEAGI